MTALDCPPVSPKGEKPEKLENEEGSEWIDPMDPVALSIRPGLPVNKEVGAVVGHDYIAEKPMQFTMRRKAFSWGEADWNITDNDGNVVFEVVGGKFGYFNVKRFLTDSDGHHILHFQKRPWNLKSKWVVQSVSTEEQMWTMYKTGVFKLFKPSIDVFLASNNDRKSPDYHIQGNLFGRKGSIVHGADTVAEVERITSAETEEDEKDTFTVTVFQGVDYAFIISLLVITDMMYFNSNSKKKNGSPVAGPTQIYPPAQMYPPIQMTQTFSPEQMAQMYPPGQMNQMYSPAQMY